MNKQKLFFTTIFLIVLIASLPLVSAYTLSYDANGNLVTGDGKFRIYDGFNHLVQVRNGDNATAPILENYTWHPMEDRIVIKDVYDNETWKETVYYPSKDFVRVENASGTFDYKYVYQNGQLVAQEDYAGNKLFMHNDHLGSVSLVTSENVSVVEQTFYEPFGKIISGGTKSRYQYEGKEYSSVVGDYDFHARKVNPDWGVFTKPDTTIQNIYDSSSLNRYEFENNNPYKYVDENGLRGIIFPLFGGGAGVGSGGAVSAGPAFSSYNGEWQFGFVNSESYMDILNKEERGFILAGEASGNLGIGFFSKDIASLQGKSKTYGGGISVGPFAGQVEKSGAVTSITWSPGIGVEAHYCPSTETTVNMWHVTNRADNTATNVGGSNTNPNTGTSGGSSSWWSWLWGGSNTDDSTDSNNDNSGTSGGSNTGSPSNTGDTESSTPWWHFW